MSYKIEITESGVSVMTQEQLYDADGNPVAMSSARRKAVGVGDYAEDPTNPTEAEITQFQAAIDGLILEKFGRDVSTAFSDLKTIYDKSEALTSERDTLKQERDSEKAAKEQALADLATERQRTLNN